MNPTIFLPFLIYFLTLIGMGTDFLNEHLECAWVTFAALILVPLGIEILDLGKKNWYYLPSILFAGAYIFFPNKNAVWLAVPYTFFILYLLLKSFRFIYSDGKLHLFDVLRVFALGYLLTGSIWALFFLGNFRPFDFSLTIVSLTVAHFHVAGFVLTVAIASLWRMQPTVLHRFLAIAALFGMPSVALGITLTQMGFPPFVEWFSGLLFAFMALGTALAYWQLGTINKGKKAILWQISAGSLAFGAVLAGLYALRFVMPLSFIHIPNMKLLHGTVNTLGFGWCCLRGLRLISKNEIFL
jgi:hypothetical protein